MLSANEIEVFLALEKTLSFTKAAELLHLSQPTISHRLKILEEELGVSLFERKKGQKRIRLTAKGEIFVPLANHWSTLWQETLTLRHGKHRLALAIGSVDSLNNTILSPIYRQLAVHNPKINLKVTTKNSLEIYELVERHELDVGFVLHEVNSNNIIIEQVCSEPMVIIRSKKQYHIQKTVHPSELDPDCEIFFNWGPSFIAWHNRCWHPRHSPHIEVDTISLITLHLADPQHWAIVPLSLVRSQQFANHFDVDELAIPAPKRVCYKITHRYPNAGNCQAIELINQYLKGIL